MLILFQHSFIFLSSLKIFLAKMFLIVQSLKAWRGELSDKVVSFAGGGMG